MSGAAEEARTSPVLDDPVLDDLYRVLKHWTPLRAPQHDDGVRLFFGDRILEGTVLPEGSERLVRELRDVDARSVLCRRLRAARPLAADIGHGSVANLSEQVRLVLDGFALRDDVRTATELIRALPMWLGGELEQERKRERDKADTSDRHPAYPSDTRLGLLRDAFLVAELSWALGSSQASKRDRDVVAAAVEAAATIASVLLRMADVARDVAMKSGYLNEDLLIRMHLARMEWIRILLGFDEYADLVADGGHALNVRLARLVGRQPDRSRRAGRFIHLFQADPLPRVGPMVRDLARLAAEGSDERSRLTVLAVRIDREEEQRFLDIAARLLLPRYLTDHAFGMLQSLQGRSPRVRSGSDAPSAWDRIRGGMTSVAWPLALAAMSGLLMFALAVGLAVVGAVERCDWSLCTSLRDGLQEAATRPVFGGLRAAIIALALLWIVGVLRALWRGDRAASYSLLLRVPAATGFGLAILLALSFDWIGTQTGLGRLGPVVAILASAVYVWIEVINQGGAGRRVPSGGRLVGRPAFDLPIIALGISTSVSVLVLEVFGRAMLTRVAGYPALRENPFVYLETLALLSSVSLAIGTFLQAIWDEQPITAPLSYLRLRG